MTAPLEPPPLPHAALLVPRTTTYLEPAPARPAQRERLMRQETTTPSEPQLLPHVESAPRTTTYLEPMHAQRAPRERSELQAMTTRLERLPLLHAPSAPR